MIFTLQLVQNESNYVRVLNGPVLKMISKLMLGECLKFDFSSPSIFS